MGKNVFRTGKQASPKTTVKERKDVPMNVKIFLPLKVMTARDVFVVVVEG